MKYFVLLQLVLCIIIGCFGHPTDHAEHPQGNHFENGEHTNFNTGSTEELLKQFEVLSDILTQRGEFQTAKKILKNSLMKMISPSKVGNLNLNTLQGHPMMPNHREQQQHNNQNPNEQYPVHSEVESQFGDSSPILPNVHSNYGIHNMNQGDNNKMSPQYGTPRMDAKPNATQQARPMTPTENNRDLHNGQHQMQPSAGTGTGNPTFEPQQQGHPIMYDNSPNNRSIHSEQYQTAPIPSNPVLPQFAAQQTHAIMPNYPENNQPLSANGPQQTLTNPPFESQQQIHPIISNGFQNNKSLQQHPMESIPSKPGFPQLPVQQAQVMQNNPENNKPSHYVPYQMEPSTANGPSRTSTKPENTSFGAQQQVHPYIPNKPLPNEQYQTQQGQPIMQNSVENNGIPHTEPYYTQSSPMSGPQRIVQQQGYPMMQNNGENYGPSRNEPHQIEPLPNLQMANYPAHEAQQQYVPSTVPQTTAIPSGLVPTQGYPNNLHLNNEPIHNGKNPIESLPGKMYAENHEPYGNNVPPLPSILPNQGSPENSVPALLPIIQNQGLLENNNSPLPSILHGNTGIIIYPEAPNVPVSPLPHETKAEENKGVVNKPLPTSQSETMKTPKSAGQGKSENGRQEPRNNDNKNKPKPPQKRRMSNANVAQQPAVQPYYYVVPYAAM